MIFVSPREAIRNDSRAKSPPLVSKVRDPIAVTAPAARWQLRGLNVPYVRMETNGRQTAAETLLLGTNFVWHWLGWLVCWL